MSDNLTSVENELENIVDNLEHLIAIFQEHNTQTRRIADALENIASAWGK